MLKYLVVLLLIEVSLGQKPSPCPKIFSYEPRGSEEDRWYGVISLQTTEDLQGIWLRIVLDQPSELLGNWFGETSSADNKEFLIKNRDYRLEAGPPVSVRFFVKYNAAATIPSVEGIRLNGKEVCSTSGAAPSTGPTLHLSSAPNRRPSGGRPSTTTTTTTQRQPTISSSTNFNQGGSSQNSGTGLSAEEDTFINHGGNGDFFGGDFAVQRPSVNRPAKRPTSGMKRNARCGTVAMRASPLISHGQNTSQGQFPWHAALYHSLGIQLTYTCGATLISENHLLTAAHCVTKPQTTRPVNPQNILVYLGKHNLKKFGTEVQDREVTDIYVHPHYNSSVFFNDIAVLKLATPADITNYVRTCCLWDDDTELESVVNKLGTVVGWGFDENRQLSNHLMQAQMPVVPTVKCIYSNREFFSQFTFDKNFCAGFRNKTSVCNGDSGGGMVFPKRGTSGQDAVWQLRGIVSVGVALQGQGVCDPDHYIVFTDVAKHLDWIRQTLEK